LVAALLLRINGYQMTADQAEAAVVFKRLAAGELFEERLTEWFRQNCTQL
jgi:death-on-curing protein